MKLNIFLCIAAMTIGPISCGLLEDNLKIFNSINNSVSEAALSPFLSTSSTDDAKKALKEKCVKVSGGEEAYTRLERGSETLKECLSGLLDIAQLQADIEEATPKGELDTVFNRYCRNRTLAVECLTEFKVDLVPCLDKDETDITALVISMVTKLLDFVCYRDGDMIALFIAENGPKCINEHKDQVANCFNSTFHKYIPTEPIDTNNLPKLELTGEHCGEFDSLQTCVVEELEKCADSTPANFVESMFKFIRKETECKNKS